MNSNEAASLLRGTGDCKEAVLVLLQEAIKNLEQRLLTCSVDKAVEAKQQLEGGRLIHSVIVQSLSSPKPKKM